MVDEESIMYLGITGIIVLIIIFTSTSFGSLRLVVIVLSLLAMCLILMIEYLDYLIVPQFTSILGIRQVPAKNYVITKKQDAIVKEVSGVYYAIGYVTANIYKYVFEAEVIQEGEGSKMASAPDTWERVAMSIKFPFRFHLVSMTQDVQAYRDTLEGKRSFLEFSLGKETTSGNPSPTAIQDLQRRINVLQTRIDRISAGERPVFSLMYVETIAVGVSEKEALDALTGQINQLVTTFNAFDLSTTRIVGREIYELFKLNYVMPDKGVLEKTFNTQK